jgi:hypothetical protein
MGIASVVINENHAPVVFEPESLTRDPHDRLSLVLCNVEGLRLLRMNGRWSASSLPLLNETDRGRT